MTKFNPAKDDSHDRRLDELIAQYLEAEEAGQPHASASILREHPELREEFAAFLSQHRQLQSDQSATVTFTGRPATAGRPDDFELSHQTIGDCRLLHELGRGGMGVVYLAEHIRLKDQRAVKILPRSRVTDNSIQRFWREARSAARINHLNVVKIYDVGHVNDVHFISMQYVNGRTLVDVLNQHLIRGNGKPMPWRIVLQLVLPVLDALSSVHNMGLVHRDIKPSNIMVTGAMSRNYHVFLMDFGLVQDEYEGGLTDSGAIVGTPSYMSREQAMGQAVDRRTDLYSIGATMYFLFTGRAPFRGSKPEVCLKVAAGEKPESLAELRPDLPSRAVDIVEKAMEPSADARYARCEELLHEITAVLEEKKRTRPKPVEPESENVEPPAESYSPAAEQVYPQAHFDTVQQSDTSEASNAGLAMFEKVPPSSPQKSTPTLPEKPWNEKLQKVASRHGPLALGIAALIVLVVFFAVLATWETPQEVASPPADEPVLTHEGMVLIPAGKVYVGASEADIRAFAFGSDQESALIEELMGKCTDIAPYETHVPAFWIDKYEVTTAQYAAFVQDTGHPAPEGWRGQQPPRGRERHPVTGVTHADAAAYARWAGKKLPTEEQWVRTFRGEQKRMYPWGDDLEESRANIYDNKEFPLGLSPVDASPEDATMFDVKNMVGNASEIMRNRALYKGESVPFFKGGNGQGTGRIYSVAPSRMYLAEDASHEFVGFRCVIEGE